MLLLLGIGGVLMTVSMIVMSYSQERNVLRQYDLRRRAESATDAVAAMGLAKSRFSCVEAPAMTRAPMSLPTCTAAIPVPPAGIRIPLQLFLALVSVRFFSGIEFSKNSCCRVYWEKKCQIRVWTYAGVCGGRRNDDLQFV